MRRANGFSIIEILIILATIGILVSLALPKFNNHFKRAKFTEVIVMTQAVQRAIEVCFYSKEVLSHCDSFEEIAREKTDFTASLYVVNIDISNTTRFTITTTATQEASINTNDTYIMQAIINDGHLSWRLSSDSSCISVGTC